MTENIQNDSEVIIQSDDDIPLAELRENIRQNVMELKPVSKQSDSDVWKYFGQLFKNKKIVIRFQDRILWKVCFQTNSHIKRYVKQLHFLLATPPLNYMSYVHFFAVIRKQRVRPICVSTYLTNIKLNWPQIKASTNNNEH